MSWRTRLDDVVARVKRLPGVPTALAVNDAYGSVGGGLLAGGLSYAALFAIIPGLLLTVSVLVLAVDDQATRKRAVDWIIEQVPPLQEVARTVVDSLASDARIGTLLGLAFFVWGAGGFYLSLRDALVRSIPGGTVGSVIRARIQAVIAVVLLVGGMLVAFVVTTFASILPLGSWAPILGPLGIVAAAVVLCLALYLLVPADRPTVREAFPAAVAAGLGIGLLTAFFSALAPLLVQGFAALGVIASVFVALVWFDWVFQMLLLGAAFARLRRDRARGITPGVLSPAPGASAPAP